MLGLMCRLASSIVGGLVPIFYSYKAVKKPTNKSLVYWLKYWAVYGVFYTSDVLLDLFFITMFIPFYEVIKLMFLVWCVSPYTGGAQFMFDKVLAPSIRRNERHYEKMLEGIMAQAVAHGPTVALQAGGYLWWAVTKMQECFGQNTDAALVHVPVAVQGLVGPGNDQRRPHAAATSTSTISAELSQSDNEDENQPDGHVAKRATDRKVRRRQVVVKQEPADSDDEIQFIGHYRHSHKEKPEKKKTTGGRRGQNRVQTFSSSDEDEKVNLVQPVGTSDQTSSNLNDSVVATRAAPSPPRRSLSVPYQESSNGMAQNASGAARSQSVVPVSSDQNNRGRTASRQDEVDNNVSGNTIVEEDSAAEDADRHEDDPPLRRSNRLTMKGVSQHVRAIRRLSRRRTVQPEESDVSV